MKGRIFTMILATSKYKHVHGPTAFTYFALASFTLTLAECILLCHMSAPGACILLCCMELTVVVAWHGNAPILAKRWTYKNMTICPETWIIYEQDITRNSDARMSFNTQEDQEKFNSLVANLPWECPGASQKVIIQKHDQLPWNLHNFRAWYNQK